MNEDTNKKKRLPVVTSSAPEKTVMPEVLPDPRTARAQTTGPRSRTLMHMQRLLATAAAVGVASVACGKEKAGNDTGESRGCGKTKPGAGPDANMSSGGSSSGYAVVDPMPMPAHCPGIAKTLTASAEPDDDGSIFLKLDGGRPDFTFAAGASLVPYGATLGKAEVWDRSIKAVISPATKTQTSFSVSVKANCSQGPVTISVQLSWTAPLTKKSKITLTLSDY